MKKIVIATIVFLLLAVGVLWAMSAAQCIYECQKNGGDYSYCKQICGR